MRIQNEQAIRDRDYHSGIKEEELIARVFRAYAADLLEAYELIKEMRSALEVVRDNTLNPAHTMTMLGLEETTDANHRLASAILEKTKDYAE